MFIDGFGWTRDLWWGAGAEAGRAPGEEVGQWAELLDPLPSVGPGNNAWVTQIWIPHAHSPKEIISI